MYRIFTAILLGLFSVMSLSGCGGILGKIVAKQEWSENYAQLPGATATTPEMIDDDLKTFGKSVFPEGSKNYYGGTAPSEAVVALPEEKLIRKVIIYSDNLKTLDIMADKGGEDWAILKEVKSATVSPFEVKVGALFKTDKIMLRIHSTTDDAAARRKEGVRGWGGRRLQSARGALANIHEIQLYGYATKEEIQAKEEIDKKETQKDELDLLLK